MVMNPMQQPQQPPQSMPPQQQQQQQTSPQQSAMQRMLQSSPMNPHASVGHLLALLDEVILSDQMNYVDKTKYIPVLTKSISELITATKAEAQGGISPDQQMQIEQQKMQMEQQKNDREHGLKLVELQHKMKMEQAKAQHEAATGLIQQAVDTTHAQQEHVATLDQMRTQEQMKMREQNHSEMMAERQQSLAEKLASDKAQATAGQAVTGE